MFPSEPQSRTMYLNDYYKVAVALMGTGSTQELVSSACVSCQPLQMNQASLDSDMDRISASKIETLMRWPHGCLEHYYG